MCIRDSAQTAHEAIKVDEHPVLGHIRQKLHHWPEDHQQAETGQNGEQAIGEHLLFAVALIQTEPDDRCV